MTRPQPSNHSRLPAPSLGPRRLLAMVAAASVLIGSSALAEAPAGKAASTAKVDPVEALVLAESQPKEAGLDDPTVANADAVWLEMIKAAKVRIDIAQFYVVSKAGSRMEAVLNALADAAKRGVKVRVIAEKIFYGQYSSDLERLADNVGVEVRVWNASKQLGGILHAKYFLVDGRDAFIGSQNFDWRSLEHIQELGVRLRSKGVVASLSDVFETDWQLAGGDSSARIMTRPASSFPEKVTYRGAQALVTPVHSPKDWLPDEDLWDLPRMLKMIDDATKTIRFTLLSYKTIGRDKKDFAEIDDALRRAAMRGVEVEFMASHWSQRKDSIRYITRLQAIGGITVKIVTIPEARDGFIPYARVIHSKYLVVDSKVSWLGTSNWSRDYFYKSRNVGLIVESAAFAADLEKAFKRTWESSYAEEVVPGRAYDEPRVGK